MLGLVLGGSVVIKKGKSYFPSQKGIGAKRRMFIEERGKLFLNLCLEPMMTAN